MSTIGSNSFSNFYSAYASRPQLGRGGSALAVQNRINFGSDTDESDGDMEVGFENEDEIEVEEEEEFETEESVEEDEELKAIHDQPHDRRKRDRRQHGNRRQGKAQLIDILA